MTTVLAIDPGPKRSAYVVYGASTTSIYQRAIVANDDLLESLRIGAEKIDLVVIEKIESFGMAVGAEVFETVFWSGQFAEAAHPLPVERLGRLAVKMTLCHDSRAKDSNIRQALIDRFGGPTAIGLKKSPGPLYGVAGDVWSALAVAIAWSERNP